MTSEQSYKIDEFCAVERLSRAMLYKLWAQGKGPRWFQVGNRRHISHEARVEWRRKLEAEAECKQWLPSSGGSARMTEARAWVARAAAISRMDLDAVDQQDMRLPTA